jgi:electron transport complex protein RnfC
MIAILGKLFPRRSFPGGIHPPDRKSVASDAPIEVLPTPAAVFVPLLQHLGAACEPVVKPKDEVAWGQMIGRDVGSVSAPVHSPVAGVVAVASVATLPNGRHVRTIPLSAAGAQVVGADLWDELFGGDWPDDGLDRYDPQEIIERIRQGGIVGMGGAGFPTHVKLAPQARRPVDTLIVNGCECEPYLTADYRLMLQAPRAILAGAVLAARASGVGRIILAVEDNKPGAIESMRRSVGDVPIEVVALKTKYPQGGERQLVSAVLGREVPTGGLPLDVGAVVINVGTSAAIAAAVLRGRPLTHRVVTVSGEGVARPGNLLVPIGARYGELVSHCGGLSDDAVTIIAGGPMTGFAVGDLDVPVTKGTSGLLVLRAEEGGGPEETPCIRCGRCVDVCPVNLVPTKIALAARAADWEQAAQYHMRACIECGCCAYGCPAGIPLGQLIRMGKAEAPREVLSCG